MFKLFNRPTEVKTAPQRVFSLSISEKIVQASLWEVEENVKILAKSSLRDFSNDNDLLIKLDQCLQELGPEGQVVHQTLFHLDSFYTDAQGILADKKPLFENITQALQLDSLGFIANGEAVLNAKLAQNPELDKQLIVEFTLNQVIFSFYQKKSLLERCVLDYDYHSSDFAALMKAALVQMAGKIGVDYNSCFLPHPEELAPSEEPKEPLFVNFISSVFSTGEIEQYVSQLPSGLPIRADVLGNDILLSYILLPSATVLAKSYGWLTLPALDDATAPPISPAPAQEPPLLTRQKFQPTVEAGDFSAAPTVADADRSNFFPLSKKSIIITVVLALITLALIAFFYILSRTTVQVSLTPKTSVLTKSLEVVIDPKAKTADYETLVLPGEVITKDISYNYDFTATGKKAVGESAKGEIEISNKTTTEKKFAGGSQATDGTYTYNFNSEVTVPAAKVETNSDGEKKTFGKAKVKVTANSPGSAGNIKSDTSLTIGTLNKDDFEAKSTENFTGGTDKTEIIFSSEDQTKALADGKKELLKQAVKDIGTQADGKYLVVQTDQLKITKQTFDAELNEKAEAVTLSLTAKIPVITYELSQLQPLAQSVLTKELPSGYQLGATQPDVLSAVNEAKTEKDGAKIFLNVNLSQAIQATLDLAVIKQDILGQSLTKVDNYLKNLANLKTFSLNWSNQLYPRVYRRLPKDSGKVNVVNTLE